MVELPGRCLIVPGGLSVAPPTRREGRTLGAARTRFFPEYRRWHTTTNVQPGFMPIAPGAPRVERLGLGWC